jgi:methionyl aminopeptidase
VVEIKTPGEIDAMREAGRVVARMLEVVRAHAAPGVPLAELDEAARQVLADARADAPFYLYKPSFASSPFPAVICTSVNDAVLHGIPAGYRLKPGDLLSIDAGATVDGWVGDAAISFGVGQARPADARLIAAAGEALRAGIAAAVPGARLGDVSAAIAAAGRRAGYGIPPDFGGHGIGRSMHEDPYVPNKGQPGRGMRLVPGLVIAIEPWFVAGGQDHYALDDDGWTVRSADGSRAAHVEHTIAITDDGPVILTAP